jgi:hypothetical protein
MSTLDHEVMGDSTLFRPTNQGPVTAARHRRNLVVYIAICALGLLPTLLGASAAWRAFGLGLMVPGGGFVAALGMGGVLALALTLGLLYLAFVTWFWNGMVVAPIAVWLGSALLAGGMAGESVSSLGLPATLATIAALHYFRQRSVHRRRAADEERLKARQGFFGESLAEVTVSAAREPAAGTRELSERDLEAVRYAFDRALQPVGEFKGYTIIDQFQPAALRYQINHLGYALGMVQCHYTPSFHGYLSQAQRNLIDTYRVKRVWDYWVLESMWGHLNFSNFDPAAKDNIMLTGYYGMQVNQYMLASGDRRYAEPGSLTFRLNDQTAYAHDAHTLVDSIRMNHARSDFCLFACEPNWVYPVCNMYGMSALASHDRLFGTHYCANILPRWMDSLRTEFTDAKGTIVGLRSYLTGHELPLFAGEAGIAHFANIFSPSLGQRLWAVGRKELALCLAPDGQGGQRLTFPREALSFVDTIDVGNYRRGMLFAYAAIGMASHEFGDDELAEAAIRSMELDCGPALDNGSLYYERGSGLATLWALEARIMRTGDYHNSFVVGPPASVFSGPLLSEARYPEVLVAKAFSHGDDLELVLYPGKAGGEQTLGFERLRAGQRYAVEGMEGASVTADAEGRASLAVKLAGRTALRLVPMH